MRLRHLGLPARDRELSRAFYEKYFGFAEGVATEYPDGTLIMRSADGFDLALHADPGHGELPEFLHFGFACESRAEVGELLERLRADGIEITEEWDEPAVASFKCLDPDGYRVEVYWEPTQAASPVAGSCAEERDTEEAQEQGEEARKKGARQKRRARRCAGEAGGRSAGCDSVGSRY